MKTPRASFSKRGFTLMELMVAMAITTIIVTVLVSITSIAIDTWNRSRAELRASRQAKAMVDTMAHDFEALVTRSGNDNEWLSAITDQSLSGGSTNAANLIFFTAATDRYNGNIGVSGDNGGDVSCVAYGLNYKDPIDQSGTYKTFVLNRKLVNPDDTFRDLLGKPDLTAAFQSYAAQVDDVQNFICENVFQFTVTFNVEVTGTTGAVSEKSVSIGQGSGQMTQSFKIKGTGIDTTAANAADLTSGHITSMEVSLTVLSDSGIDLLRKVPSKATDAAWLAKNSYQYSKVVQLPGM